MTALPEIFPFSRLKLQGHEALEWVGYNPTFHRFTKYGLAISDAAFYVCWRSLIFASWRRYPLSDISNVAFVGDEDRRPELKFQVGSRKMAFRTPIDFHTEDVNFDRGVLFKAAEHLRSKVRQ